MAFSSFFICSDNFLASSNSFIRIYLSLTSFSSFLLIFSLSFCNNRRDYSFLCSYSESCYVFADNYCVTIASCDYRDLIFCISYFFSYLIISWRSLSFINFIMFWYFSLSYLFSFAMFSLIYLYFLTYAFN